MFVIFIKKTLKKYEDVCINKKFLNLKIFLKKKKNFFKKLDLKNVNKLI